MEPPSNGYLGPVEDDEDIAVDSSAGAYTLPDYDTLADDNVSDTFHKLPDLEEEDIQPVSSGYLGPQANKDTDKKKDGKEEDEAIYELTKLTHVTAASEKEQTSSDKYKYPGKDGKQNEDPSANTVNDEAKAEEVSNAYLGPVENDEDKSNPTLADKHILPVTNTNDSDTGEKGEKEFAANKGQENEKAKVEPVSNGYLGPVETDEDKGNQSLVDKYVLPGDNTNDSDNFIGEKSKVSLSPPIVGYEYAPPDKMQGDPEFELFKNTVDSSDNKIDEDDDNNEDKDDDNNDEEDNNDDGDLEKEALSCPGHVLPSCLSSCPQSSSIPLFSACVRECGVRCTLV